MITTEDLRPYLATTLADTHFPEFGEKYRGKVRDVYLQKAAKQQMLVATDRQSAFDIDWCTIPLKGQVLTQISAWWFEQIADIMPTQVVAVPDPNVMLVQHLDMLKVEVVVRGYLTGSSKTSAWVNYNNGVRNFCGVQLPEDMQRNQQFAAPIITPTTKGEEDELIDPAGIVEQGLATAEQWAEIEEKALAIFARGQKLALERGLLLVDTKYEIGVDANGTLTIADEVHTPDSSRYWVADSYEERYAAGQEPESLDKEFFRLWLREQGYEDGGDKPEITDDVRLMLARKYIDLYERVTGTTFVLPEVMPIEERIRTNMTQFFAEHGAA